MARPIVRATIVGLVLAAVTLFLLIRAMLWSFEVRCEVCVTYEGRVACREASGRTAEEAQRTATDNACAFLASGMTQTVQCTGRTPTRVTCN